MDRISENSFFRNAKNFQFNMCSFTNERCFPSQIQKCNINDLDRWSLDLTELHNRVSPPFDFTILAKQLSEKTNEEVVIVGGGVAGLATALALKRVGVRALVLERSKELRTTGAALTLFPNAWKALEALGVAEKLTAIYAPYSKGIVTDVAKGTTQEVIIGSEGTEWKATGPRAVHRKALLEALAEELPTDMIRFSSKVSSIESQHSKDTSSSMNIIRLEDGTTIQAKILIGCDGVHSVVARWLGLRDPVHSGRFAVRGISVFPEGHGMKHEVQQFLNKGRRAGIAPLNDKELYWFLTYQSVSKKDEEMATGDSNLIQKKVLEDLASFPLVLLDVIQHSDLSTLSWAPLMFRYPWNLIFGHLSNGTIMVAGDSMHPMTPDLGQGGCLALEDAVILGRHIGNSKVSQPLQWENKEMARRSIEMYTKERRWRGAAMITASYLSGWVQQGGGSKGDGESSGWLMKFLRDTIFYKILYRRILGFANFDCGKLPIVSSSSQVTGNENHCKKID